MRYQITHQTKYSYESIVTLSQQLLFMSPKNFRYQTCISHNIRTEPNPNESLAGADYFNNIKNYISIFAPHKTLEVSAESIVDVLNRPTLDKLLPSPPWEEVKAKLSLGHWQEEDPINYLYASVKAPADEVFSQYAELCFTPNRPLIEAAFELTQRIYRDFEFDAESTDISTPLIDFFTSRRGVCQDFSHLMISCLRSLGLACRYVSGYILTTPAAGQPRLIGADASHAWVSVYCPINGWVDFDPTNYCLVNDQHITVAWGRDFNDVSPMRGTVLGGGKQTLDVSVTMTPVFDHELSIQLPLNVGNG